MKRLLVILACSLVSLTGFSNLQADDQDNPDIEIQARGPVHEAFAQPYRANPAPVEGVDKQPPDPIPEEPAAEKPEGKNVQWIPGYWQWDGDKKDFIWVSGIWRDLPEGRRWVMGYWAKTDNGYRWVSGHFANANERDNQYVPEPPENPDEGPTTSPPDDDSSYVPGSWFYGDDGYTYRTGYWTQCYDDRVWIPSYYNWTPYGYEFCSGYWDYPLYNRGLLFAPVYFHRPLWYAANWFFRPWYAIGYGGLYNNFFIGFGHHHYFFGDYYARSYLNRGIYPWYWGSRHHYDPIWSHQRWVHRGDHNWSRNFQSNYIGRVNGTMGLPPRTLSAQRTLASSGRLSDGSQRMVQSLTDARQAGMKLQTVSHQQQVAHMQSARTMVNQARNLSRSAPQVSAQPRTTSFNRSTVNGHARTGAAQASQTTGANRSFTPSGNQSRFSGPSANRSLAPSGSPRFSTPSTNRSLTPSGTQRGSMPRITTPSTNRSFTPSGPQRGAMPRITSPSGTQGGAGPRITTPSQNRSFAPSGVQGGNGPRFSSPSMNRPFSPSSGRSFTPSSRPSMPSMGGASRGGSNGGSFHGSGGGGRSSSGGGGGGRSSSGGGGGGGGGHGGGHR